MNRSNRPWLVAAILAGAAYVAIAKGFTRPVDHPLGWRRAAWLASGLVFASHFWYERFPGRTASPRSIAARTAAGVAIGAAGLAALGVAHSLSTTSTVRPLMLLSLVLWPLLTAIPAFLVAFIAAVMLGSPIGEPVTPEPRVVRHSH